MREAVATHMTRAGEKLRRQRLAATAIHVFLCTNPHRADLPQCFPAANLWYGRGTVRPATVGMHHGWQMRQGQLSPRYTTRLSGMPKAKL